MKEEKKIHKFLKAIWIMRYSKRTQENHFNIYNPVAWCLLIVVAFVVGVYEGLVGAYKAVAYLVKDGYN